MLSLVLSLVLSALEMKTQLLRQISALSGSESGLESEILTDPDRARSPGSKKRRRRTKSVEDISPTINVRKGQQLIQEEFQEEGAIKSSVLVNYMRACGFLFTSLMALGYVCFTGCQIGGNIWLNIWSNDSLSLNGTQDKELTNLRLGVYGAIGAGQVIFLLIGVFSIAYGTLNASGGLHLNIVTNIMRAPMAFFDTTPLGRIMNRCSKDIDTLDITIPINLRITIKHFTTIAATLIVISYSTPIFLVVVVPLAIFYFFIQRFYVSCSRQLKRIDSVRRSPIYSHFSETLLGVSSIRAFRQERRFINSSDQMVDENQMAWYPNIISNRWVAFRLELIGTFIVLFAALFAVIAKEGSGISASLVGLSVSYSLEITSALQLLIRQICEFEVNVVAAERIKEYTEVENEAPWDIPDTAPSNTWPQNGLVEFKNYSTRYRPGLDLVVTDITCDVSPGEKIGIVGRTGAGKSSLTLALFRIIEPAQGSIRIDGIDIAQLGLHQLRSKITIIPQDPVLFCGTLRMNLDPFEQYTDDYLWNALEHAHLKDFVKSLPDGLQYECSEGGENLSVGQRQLVCLARALLRNTKILVLDEATAAVDLETDDLIQSTIRAEFRNSTVLTIAHRLNTIMDYDRVLVLDKGKVKEYDSPQNLLNNKNSIFHGMARDAGLV